MSRSTVDCLLRLEADAWVLRTPAGVWRQPHGGGPAPELERLAGDMPPRGTALQVVLGDGWLRYLVLRWPPSVRPGEERAAYMAHRFREVHEVTESDWVFAQDRDAVNFPMLACAAPASLVAALQVFAQAHELRLGSVTGDFVDRFNHLQRSFDETPGTLAALALVRDGRLTVGLWRDGEWQAVHCRMMSEDGPADLDHMLAVWRAELAPAQTGVLYAHGIAPVDCPDWRVVRVDVP